jgi:hypothetical protein
MVLETCFRNLLVYELYRTNYTTLGIRSVHRSVFAKNYKLTLKEYENNYERQFTFKQNIGDTYIKIS